MLSGKKILGELMTKFNSMYRVAALMTIPPHAPLPSGKNGSILGDGQSTGGGRLSATEVKQVHTALPHILDGLDGCWKTKAVIASAR